jgi:Uma2 family endonuclease
LCEIIEYVFPEKALAFRGRMIQVVPMAVVNPVHRLTEAEYLEIERRAEFKSEFLDGEIFAMSGGASSHSLIKYNLIRALGNQLEGSPCVVYDSDMRIKVQEAGLYMYPDVSVVCGGKQVEDEHDDVLLNPIVIVEVLSDSTGAYDRGRKFEMYRQIPSLREFLLVNQYKPHIEQFIRQDSGEWLLRDVAGLESKLSLPSVGIAIAMASVYSNVQFAPDSRRPGKPASRS